MDEKQAQNTQQNGNEKKRKSKFGVVVGVIVIILAMVFAFLALSQKEKYTVLDNSSKEVKSMITSIKDVRTLKGYKVVAEQGDNKLVLISAGLSYDPDGAVEVKNVEFDKGSAKIVVSEQINANPEKEKVTYPFVIVKLDSKIDKITVVTESGEEYKEIIVNKHTNEGVVDDKGEPVESEEDSKEEIEKEESEEDSKEEIGKEDSKEEIEKEESEEDSKEDVVATKTLACVYQGKADATTIEISVGNDYRTFDITDVVGSFDNIQAGQQITIEYIDTLGNGKVVSVK